MYQIVVEVLKFRDVPVINEASCTDGVFIPYTLRDGYSKGVVVDSISKRGHYLVPTIRDDDWDASSSDCIIEAACLRIVTSHHQAELTWADFLNVCVTRLAVVIADQGVGHNISQFESPISYLLTTLKTSSRFSPEEDGNGPAVPLFEGVWVTGLLTESWRCNSRRNKRTAPVSEWSSPPSGFADGRHLKAMDGPLSRQAQLSIWGQSHVFREVEPVQWHYITPIVDVGHLPCANWPEVIVTPALLKIRRLLQGLHESLHAFHMRFALTLANIIGFFNGEWHHEELCKFWL